MKKRMFSILLALLLTLANTPLAVYAASDSTIPQTIPQEETTAPTTEPVIKPTIEATTPSTEPVPESTDEPTTPTTEPTAPPSSEETTAPTTEPTTAPTEETTAPTTEPTTAPTTEPETEPSDALTQAEIEEQLASVPHLTLTQDFTLESDFTIPKGKHLTISYMTVPAGCTLTIEGSLYVEPSEITGTGKLIAEEGSTVVIGENCHISTYGNSDLGDFCPVIGIDLKHVTAGYNVLDNVKFSDVVTQSWIDATLKKYKRLALGTTGPQVITRSLTLPQNVFFNTNDLTIAQDCTLTNHGDIRMQSGYFTIHGTLDNQGSVNMLIQDQLKNNGTLLGNPIIFKEIPQTTQDQLESELASNGYAATNNHVTLVRDFHIPSQGSIDVTVGGRITIPAGITMKVDGKVRLTTLSSIVIEEGGVLEINHSVLVAANSKITNDGTITLKEAGSVLTIRFDSELTGKGNVQEIGGFKLDYKTFGKNPKSDLSKLAACADKLHREDILSAVQSMGSNVLTYLMQPPKNNATVEDLATLEQAIGGPAQVIVKDSDSLEIDANRVTVIGAKLNQTQSDLNPELIIGLPNNNYRPIPDSCDKQLAILFSMNLSHVDDSDYLPVPVCISIPIPAKLTAENLAIIHYDHGFPKILRLTKDNIYSVDGQRYATVVLTSFSDFALAPLLDTTEPTEEPITQAELEEILASTEYYELEQNLTLESDFTLPKGKILGVSAALTIPSGCTLTVDGTIHVTPSPYGFGGSGILIAEDGADVIIGPDGIINAIATANGGDFNCIFGIDHKRIHARYEIVGAYEPSFEEIQSWLNATSQEYLDVYLSIGIPVLDTSLTIPENVYFEFCDFTINKGCTLTNYGEIHAVQGLLTNNGTIDNRGMFTLYTRDQLRGGGAFLGNPITILEIPQSAQDKLEAELEERNYTGTSDSVRLVRDFHIPANCGADIVAGGSIIIPKGITMTVDGNLSAYNWSNIVVEAGGHLEINGSATIGYYSSLTNNGTISLRAKDSILKIRSDGKLLGDGKIHEIGGVNLDQTAFGENPKKDLDKLNSCKDQLYPGEILDAVQSIGSDKLAQAMQSPKNNAAVEDLAALEQAAGGHAQVIVNDPGSLEIDANQVTVIGARLNQTRFDPEPKLIIGPPDGVDNPIPSGCDHTLAIHFSMHLENVGDPENLLVPVCISIPIPKKLPAENLAIVHYHQDGSHEIIYLTKDNIYSEKGQWYASIVLTSFSDFALVPLLEAPAPELDLEAMAEPIQGLTTENVTSAHREAIDKVLNDVDAALKLDNLTQEQTKALNELKDNANALLAAVNKAHAEVNTEQIHSALAITPESLELHHEEALDHAYDVLSKAAASSNFTEDEQKALRQKADSIQEKRTMIDNAKKTIVLLNDLPEKVSADNLKHREAVSSALDAFAELHPQEQRLVGQDLADKLNRLKKSLEYRITQGNNSIWKRSSTKGLTITANGPVELFKGIEVDGTAVSQRHYAVSSGSTVVTLKPHFLDDLKLGRHSITFVYENDFGGTEDLTASSTFRISSIFSFNPQTGDTIYITISILVLSTLALAIMFLWIYGKKRKK